MIFCKQKDPVKMSQVNEVRTGMYGALNLDPKMKNLIIGGGLTTNYKQMLQNDNNYFISQGIKSGKELDLNKTIVLNKKPKQTNLGYTYGELTDNKDIDYKKMKEAWTTDYNEMLMNPDKKVMILGIHPELSTMNTRVIAPQMEDPIIIQDPEEVKQQMIKKQNQLDIKTKQIQEYLDSVYKQLVQDSQLVSDNQIKIVKEIKQYLETSGEKDQKSVVFNFKETIDKILHIFTQKVEQQEKKNQEQNDKKDEKMEKKEDKKDDKKDQKDDKKDKKDDKKSRLKQNILSGLQKIKKAFLSQGIKLEDNKYNQEQYEEKLKRLQQKNKKTLENLLKDESDLKKQLQETDKLLKLKKQKKKDVIHRKRR